MPTGQRIDDYFHGRLAIDAEERLNDMAELAGATSLMKEWNRHVRNFDTTWFYEGTLRAVVYDCLDRWLRRRRNREWILVAEQRYPAGRTRDRADVALCNEADEWLFVEIKADFGATGPQSDVGKLVEACAELQRRYVGGLLLFTVWNEDATINRWTRELERMLNNGRVAYARPLTRL